MTRLLATDLDGTLLNSRKEITPYTLQVLLEAQKCGVRIVIASGRPMSSTLPVARQLQLETYKGFLLCFNGGLIYDCHAQKTLYTNYLPASYIPMLYEESRKAGFAIMSYVDGSIATEQPEDQYIQYAARINGRPLVHLRSFTETFTQDVPKCIITGEPDPLHVLELQMQARYYSELSIIRSEPFFLEVMNKGVEKGKSLAVLLEMTGIGHEDLMAFGDGFNDGSMLRLAGKGVAMRNAQPEVRAMADDVTASNDEDGVAQYVERHFLLA